MRRLVIGLCVAVGVLAAVVFYRFAVRASRGGEESPLYSIRRYDPYGTAALFELLRERGIDVRPWRRPDVDTELRGTLVQVLPSRRDKMPAHELRHWIAEGNTVIQLTRDRSELFELCGGQPGTRAELAAEIERLQEQGRPPDELPEFFDVAEWCTDAADVLGWPGAFSEPLVLRGATVFPEVETDRWHPLARSDAGVVAGVLTFGRGRLILVGAPTAALNHSLAYGGNLDLLLAALGTGPVLFDEWSHGLGQSGNVASLVRELGLVPLVAQTLLVLALYIWSTSGWHLREPTETPRRRSSAEQIETLAYLYSQTLGNTAAVKLVEAELRRRLAEALACAPADLERVCRAAKTSAAERAGQSLRTLTDVSGRVRSDRSARLENELVKLLDAAYELNLGEPRVEE